MVEPGENGKWQAIGQHFKVGDLRDSAQKLDDLAEHGQKLGKGVLQRTRLPELPFQRLRRINAPDGEGRLVQPLIRYDAEPYRIVKLGRERSECCGLLAIQPCME